MGKKLIYHLGLATDAALGSKGTALNEMAAFGLPVPPGFVVAKTAEATRESLIAAIRKVGKGFGDPEVSSLRAWPRSCRTASKPISTIASLFKPMPLTC
jgi:phosphoenolpyruvate synthase/pyruvate phosphate dikinase